VLEFTSKSFVKIIFEKLISPHVCTKKFDLSDVGKKRFSGSHEIVECEVYDKLQLS
jgi:hypothetical protein